MCGLALQTGTLLRRGGFVQAYTGHFPTYIGPVAAVEIQQAVQCDILGVPDVRLHEMVGQSGAAQLLEVHSQESNLGGYVNIPKAFIEFDAIDNAYLLMVEKIDVFRPQVTVAIPDASLLFTLRKPIGVVLGERAYRLLDLGVGLLGERLPNTVCGLPKVLLPIGEHLGQGAKAFGSRGEGVGLVEGRQKLCKCLYHLRCHGVTLKVDFDLQTKLWTERIEG